MGNPSLPTEAFHPTGKPSEPSPNGILPQVGGQFIAQGSQSLPPAGQAEKEEPQRTATVEVPDLGAVRITYQLNRYKHGRSWHWHWLAVRADRAE